MAQEVDQYRGQGFSLLGDKHRFVLPPKIRKVVKESSHGVKTLLVDKHHEWNCLIGFGQARADSFKQMMDREEQLATARGEKYDRDLRADQISNYEEIPFDESGRFVLPRHLMELVGITDSVYFRSVDTFFAMWAPAEIRKMGSGWEVPIANCNAAEAAARGRKA